MSRRIYFSHGSKDGALGHFLSAPLEEFRAWLKHQCHNDEESVFIIEPSLLPTLDQVLIYGVVAFMPETSEKARLLDSLIYWFYAWCDWERKDLLNSKNALLSAHRYEAVAAEIHTYFGEEAHRLWKYMLYGRSIWWSESLFPYTPFEEGYPKSFWTYEEVGYLYYRMKSYKEIFRDLFGPEGESPVRDVFRAVKDAFESGVGLIVEIA